MARRIHWRSLFSPLSKAWAWVPWIWVRRILKLVGAVVLVVVLVWVIYEPQPHSVPPAMLEEVLQRKYIRAEEMRGDLMALFPPGKNADQVLAGLGQVMEEIHDRSQGKRPYGSGFYGVLYKNYYEREPELSFRYFFHLFDRHRFKKEVRLEAGSTIAYEVNAYVSWNGDLGFYHVIFFYDDAMDLYLREMDRIDLNNFKDDKNIERILQKVLIGQPIERITDKSILVNDLALLKIIKGGTGYHYIFCPYWQSERNKATLPLFLKTIKHCISIYIYTQNGLIGRVGIITSGKF